jgi:ABC-type Fe3+-hydroxamate transport system substrate-binding protein
MSKLMFNNKIKTSKPLSILVLSLIFFILICFTTQVQAKGVKYISLAPSITEIIYAINAQDNLIAGVAWNNKLMKGKPVIGDAFFINNEALVKYHPDIIFALSSQKPLIENINLKGTRIFYFSFNGLDDIFQCIKLIGNLTGHSKQGNLLISQLHTEISKHKAKTGKKILFVVQAEPLISVGKNSYINDIITQSGHINIMKNLKNDYPTVNIEYVIMQKPDLVVVWDKQTKDYLSKLLHCKFVVLNPDQCDYINRPGPSVIKAVKFFASL